ncbi:MAG: 4Fe-4S ferredoxin [Firmicutes bacterium]|nr:4Fe-4S ferredoxin [Bacillota bacterium]
MKTRKKWYPVIDILSGMECGSCVSKCSHGVCDKERFPVPVVVYPDGCVDHCHGCGNLCPQGAIPYVGEDTGWTPPNGKPAAVSGCCGTK